MAGICECDNEPSGSIKCEEFFDWMKTGLLLKKGSAPWNKQVNYDILPLFVKEMYRFTAGRVFRVFKPHCRLFLSSCVWWTCRCSCLPVTGL